MSFFKGGLKNFLRETIQRVESFETVVTQKIKDLASWKSDSDVSPNVKEAPSPPPPVPPKAPPLPAPPPKAPPAKAPPAKAPPAKAPPAKAPPCPKAPLRKAPSSPSTSPSTATSTTLPSSSTPTGDASETLPRPSIKKKKDPSKNLIRTFSEEERLQGGGNLQETCSIKESTTESASSSGKNDAESESPSNLRSYVKQQKTSKFSRIVSAEERTAFTKAVMALMHSSGKWTFAKYRAYIQALMKEQGTDTVKHRLLSKYFSQSDEFKLMEQKLTVLETFTPTELKGTSWTQFSFEDRLLIAEAAKVPPNFVLQMLYEFDQLKTDRSWYLRRMALGRPLPNSRIEREWMAECDRMVYNKIRGKMMPLETFIGRCQEKNPGKMPRYEIFRLTGKGRRGRPSLWGDAKQQYTRKCIVKRQKTFSTSPVPRTWLGSLKNVKIKKPFRF